MQERNSEAFKEDYPVKADEVEKSEAPLRPGHTVPLCKLHGVLPQHILRHLSESHHNIPIILVKNMLLPSAGKSL